MKKITLLLLLSAHVCLAQVQYTSTNKKAVKSFEKALEYYEQRKDADALDELTKTIKIDSTFVEAHAMIAELYGASKNMEQSLYHSLIAIRLNPKMFPNLLYNSANIEMGSGKYSAAKSHYAEYLKQPRLSEETRKKTLFLYEKAAFAENAVKHPVPFNPENLGNKVNSEFDEYLPALTADERTLIITRKTPIIASAGNDPKNLGEDFFKSELVNGTWTKSENMGKIINTEGNEGAQCISPDGQTLFFTACEEFYGYPGGRKGYGRCDIFYSFKVGDDWTTPKNIGAPINSASWESQPNISSDGRTLYFASNRPGGKGGVDLWKSILGDDSRWGAPINLGDSINTPYDDLSPFIHPDNKTMYFCSEGHPGMGKEDLFLTRMDKNGDFSKPVNLGYPINTVENETSLIVNASGKTAYYSSAREGGSGKLDIYSFTLNENLRPVAVTYMKGRVYDNDTKKSLEARFELIDLETGEQVMEAYSNRGNGEFLVCLPVNKNYALNVSKTGYLFYSENFSLKNTNTQNDPFMMDVPLRPIKAGEKVILKNIFFETAKFNLAQESRAELKKLILFMTKNPTLTIEIGGHTDNVGTKEYNKTLSHNRAKAVYDYLIENKVAKERLTFNGFGDSVPIAPNDTEAGRALNRRTEFTVVSH